MLLPKSDFGWTLSCLFQVWLTCFYFSLPLPFFLLHSWCAWSCPPTIIWETSQREIKECFCMWLHNRANVKASRGVGHLPRGGGVLLGVGLKDARDKVVTGAITDTAKVSWMENVMGGVSVMPVGVVSIHEGVVCPVSSPSSSTSSSSLLRRSGRSAFPLGIRTWFRRSK